MTTSTTRMIPAVVCHITARDPQAIKGPSTRKTFVTAVTIVTSMMIMAASSVGIFLLQPDYAGGFVLARLHPTRMETTMAETELMPCRWCDPETSTNIPHLCKLPPDRGPQKWAVICLGCCASGPVGFTPEDACKFWNRRSVSSPIQEGSGAQVPHPMPSTAGSVPVSDYAIRRAAIALSKAHGLNPDCLHWHEPGERNRRDDQPWPDDATLANGRPAHFGWRHKVPDVRVVIAAFTRPSQQGASDTEEQDNAQVEEMARALEEAERRLGQAAAVLEKLGHHAAATGFLSDAKAARAALSSHRAKG